MSILKYIDPDDFVKKVYEEALKFRSLKKYLDKDDEVFRRIPENKFRLYLGVNPRTVCEISWKSNRGGDEERWFCNWIQDTDKEGFTGNFVDIGPETVDPLAQVVEMDIVITEIEIKG